MFYCQCCQKSIPTEFFCYCWRICVDLLKHFVEKSELIICVAITCLFFSFVVINILALLRKFSNGCTQYVVLLFTFFHAVCLWFAHVYIFFMNVCPMLSQQAHSSLVQVVFLWCTPHSACLLPCCFTSQLSRRHKDSPNAQLSWQCNNPLSPNTDHSILRCSHLSAQFSISSDGLSDSLGVFSCWWGSVF